MQVLVDVGRALLSLRQIIAQLLKQVGGVGGTHLQQDEFVVAVVNVLDVFLILNLQLVEINEFEFFAHFVLVLDLSFFFDDGSLQRQVLGLQFVNELLLLLKLVEHVLGKLFCVVLANAAIFSSGQETAKVESLLTDLGNGQISAFQNSLESLQKGL